MIITIKKKKTRQGGSALTRRVRISCFCQPSITQNLSSLNFILNTMYTQHNVCSIQCILDTKYTQCNVYSIQCILNTVYPQYSVYSIQCIPNTHIERISGYHLAQVSEKQAEILSTGQNPGEKRKGRGRIK